MHFWRWRYTVSERWWSFPHNTVFRPYDPLIQPDFISPSWVCFLEYPFYLGLKFPFSGVISKSFEVTKLPYVQVMSIIWRILYWVEYLNQTHRLDIGLAELSQVCDVSTFSNSRFLFKVKNKCPRMLNTKHNDETWKERYFFFRCDSIPSGIFCPNNGLRRVGF